MLLTLLALQLAAVDVTGMPPQIALIRATAADRKWPITCQGKRGEETVVRLKLSAGTTYEGVTSALGGEQPFTTSIHQLNADEVLARGCNYPVPEGPPHREMRVLAINEPAVIEKRLVTAKACGMPHAFIREARPGEYGPEKLPEGYKALDAGEDVGSRDGLVLCFLQMRHRMP